MKRIKVIVILILLLACTVTICGCWNYKELDRMFVVMGAAVDKDYKTGNYIVTIETMTPKGGKDTRMITQIISSEGETILDAIRNAIKKSGRKMYWGHAIIWIIGKDVAQEGILPVIDMINRSKEIRSDILVAVSNNVPSSQFFSKTDQAHDSVSRHLFEMFNENKSAGKYREVPLWKTIDDISDNAVALTLPIIEVDKNAPGFQVSTVRSGVFKGEKMIGEINETETRSTLILRGELKNKFVLAFPSGKKNGLPASSLEVSSSTTKIIVDSNNGNPQINIYAILYGKIIELQSSMDFFTDGNRFMLEKEYANLLKDQMKIAIIKAQKELKVDIFGFGKEVRIQKPGLWKNIEGNWNENFENLQCSINVTVKITGSSLEMKPIKVGGE